MNHKAIGSFALFILSIFPAAPLQITGYLPAYRLESTDRALGSEVLDLSGFSPDYSSRRIVSPLNLEYAVRSFPASYRFEKIEDWYGRNVDEIIYFSLMPGEDGSLNKSSFDNRDMARLSNISHLYGTRLTLAVSGSSEQFAQLARDESLREKFLAELALFSREKGFTGVDLDWEYPKNDEESGNFALLVGRAKEIMEPLGIKLSAAVSRSHLLSGDVLDTLDSVNLMAYDNYGRHSTYESAVEAVEYLKIRYDVDPGKIRLGIPFYGRIYSGLDPQYWTRTMIYRDIRKEYDPDPQSDEAGGFYFNGLDTVRKKTAYARENGLGGVMIWELGQDSLDSSSLLEAIREEAK